MKKKISVVLSFLLLMSIVFSIPAYAADAEVIGSSQIAGTYAEAAWSKTTPGLMGVYYSITASGRMEKIGATKVEIYRYLNKQWELEKTVRVEDYPEMQGSDDVLWQATVSYYTKYLDIPYYAIVYFYCKGPYGISTLEHSTNII